MNSSAYANSNSNNNTLVESEARPEQFNFTFNPKDEEIEGAAAEAAATGFPNNYTSRQSPMGSNSADLKISKHQSTGQKASQPNLERVAEISIHKQSSQASVGYHSNALRNRLERSLGALSPTSSVRRLEVNPGLQPMQVPIKQHDSGSRQHSPSQGGTTATRKRPSQLSQFLSSSKDNKHQQHVINA